MILLEFNKPQKKPSQMRRLFYALRIEALLELLAESDCRKPDFCLNKSNALMFIANR